MAFVSVARQHVVVEVDGAAVVNGVAQAVFEHLLAGVGGQTELKEACLSRGQAVRPLVGQNNTIELNLC